MKLSCLMPRGLTVLAAVSLAVFPVGSALAQYAPYSNYNAYQPRPAVQNQYQPRNQFMAGPQVQQSYAPQTYIGQQPQYVAMAQQSAPAPLPPMPPQMETVAPGAMQQQGGYAPAPQPTQMDYSQMGSQPMAHSGGYENYGAPGCATGNCGNGAGYSCDGYGNYNCPPSYGCCEPACCRPKCNWFGGVYGLLMDRVECGNGPIVYQTTMPGTGHYPTYDEVVMSYGDLDGDVQPGFEVRFGATLPCCGGNNCDPCGGCNSCGSTVGWEVGYWMLDEESTTHMVNDMVGGPTFTHTMKRFDRLEHYYDGTWRPLNHFYSYGVPTQDYWTAWGNIAPQLTYVSARSSFSAQSVEVNLVCLPTISGGSCAPACDPCGGGCCDSCGGGSCCGSGGHGGRFGGCCGAYSYCGPRWSCSSSIGARYFRFDDDYMFNAEWEMYDYAGGATTGDTGSLAYYTDLNNQLFGFQFGGSGCYHCGCCGRLALHLGANAGIYANYIEMNQYFNGDVRDMGTMDAYNVMAEDDNYSFLGELRLGASYQCTCHCRLYGGYRAFGVTGVAVNYNQYAATTDMPVINCDGSLFLHGLQTGVEFMY
jgi:hypothetical protein